MNSDDRIIYNFESISLKDLEQLQFINRFDLKYIFNYDLFINILKSMINDYKILDINGKRKFNYINNYYDTKDFKLYLAHHNDRKNRFKIRTRYYIDSDQTYLEIKLKNNKNLTDKIRMKLPENNVYTILNYNDFFMKNLKQSSYDFEHKIKISYERLTFVNLSNDEKITFDLNLRFEKDGYFKIFRNLVITEIKTLSRAKTSILQQEFVRLGIHSIGFSKYEIGCILFYNHLKYNKFKENILTIEKIG